MNIFIDISTFGRASFFLFREGLGIVGFVGGGEGELVKSCSLSLKANSESEDEEEDEEAFRLFFLFMAGGV